MSFASDKNPNQKLPLDENSPLVREWLRTVKPTISEEEMRRRETAGDGISTAELLVRLKDRKKD